MCLFVTNPTFLIVWLVILRINIGVIFRATLTIWITYAVILLFTGGMIILFTYIVTITSRLKIVFSNFPIMLIVIWIRLLLIKYQPLYYRYFSWNLTNLYLNSSMWILIILAVYLLLVLFVVVKVATSHKGPIKSFFKNET